MMPPRTTDMAAKVKQAGFMGLGNDEGLYEEMQRGSTYSTMGVTRNQWILVGIVVLIFIWK